MSSTEILKISIIGAGGKTGFRALENLSKESYALYFCVKSPVGIKKIETKGFSISPAEEAVPQSDVMILSVPDKLIKTVSTELVPLMKSDATCILLDPAAAYLGEVELGQDCSFVVSHPCHPALFAEQDSLEALKDHFGGTLAKKDIVVALFQGSEKNFEDAREICIKLFGQTKFPVSDAAKVAFEIGKEYLIKPDWQKAFQTDELRKTVQRMIQPQ